MADKPLTTVWMWKDDEGEVWGLTLNQDRQKVEWADSIGCACGDSFAEQTFADFLAKGPRYGNPPEDVLNEAVASVKALQNN
jgi:hypothetical protein